MVKKKEIYSQKEKNLFWMGLSVALVGSLLINIWTVYFSKFSENPNLINFGGFVIFTIILLGLLLFVKNQIIPVKK